VPDLGIVEFWESDELRGNVARAHTHTHERAHRQREYSNSFVTSAVTAAAADDVLSSIYKNKQPRGARVL